MSQLILASTSPRRKELLKFLGVRFKVVPSGFKEDLIEAEDVVETVEELAREKAWSVARLLDSDEERFLVVGGDTLIEDRFGLIGKVKSEKELKEVLERLSGEKHRIVTGIAVVDSWSRKVRVESEESWVKFRDLNQGIIEKYAKLSLWRDKAGGYAIQEDPMGLVESFEGNLSNIVGLPLGLTRKLLEEMGYEVGVGLEDKLLEDTLIREMGKRVKARRKV